MKKIILLLTVLFSFQAYAQYGEYGEEELSNLTWLTDLDQAKKESTTQNKPILIYFTGSDWCGPCKMLKKDFFSSEEFEKKSTKFVLLKVDMPRRVDIITPEQKIKNKKVVKQYNKSGGYPNLVALNNNGEVLGELSGYTFLRETDRHFNFVNSILDKY